LSNCHELSCQQGVRQEELVDSFSQTKISFGKI
jgi:hypothetical protein